ncbi:hypothetical protein HY78_01100 [Rhizorhabdus wittichii DC-6]|nr:hypothetical protein HY78_01100 [Rhizorhabdus wittichii DC-6]
MVERTPRIPASADSMAAKLEGADHFSDLIDVIDTATAALCAAQTVLNAIDELNLGLGGSHYDTLCTLCNIGERRIAVALADLRAIPTGSATA